MPNNKLAISANNPLISVVIPLYNKESTIRRAVSSILGQSYRNFELIIIDDGSTDQSVAAIERISDPRIKLLSQENKGVSAARNRGVKAASSGYVSFLDADDEWDPEFLAARVDDIRMQPDCALYCCGHSVKYEMMRVLRPPPPGWRGRGIIEHFFDVYPRYQVTNSAVATVLKSHFVDIGGFTVSEPWGEDIALWLRLANQGSVFYNDRVLATVHRNDEACRSLRTGRNRFLRAPEHIAMLRSEIDGLRLVNKDKLINNLCLNGVAQSFAAVRGGRRGAGFLMAKLVSHHNIGLAISIAAISALPIWCLDFVLFFKRNIYKIKTKNLN